MRKLFLIAFILMSVNCYSYNWKSICRSICKEQKTLLHKSEHCIADRYKKNRKLLSFYYDNVSCETDTIYFLESFDCISWTLISTFWIKTDKFPLRGFLTYMAHPSICHIWDFQADQMPYPLDEMKFCNDWNLDELCKPDGEDFSTTSYSDEILTRVILYKRKKYKVDCLRITRKGFGFY